MFQARLLPSFFIRRSSRLVGAAFFFVAVAALFFATVASPTFADTFGSGANEFEIEFVPIGAVGNAADTTGDPNPAGAVDYFYRMGKYEISESMIDAANAATAGSDDPLELTHANYGPNKPANAMSWFEAARFVNWLNESEGYLPAYKFDDQNEFQLWEPTDNGYDAENLFRNRRARYFLPSADEWYKAAYYDPATGVWYDYPTGSNEIPDGVDFIGDTEFEVFYRQMFPGIPEPNDITNVGVFSPFGTAGQGGNVWEWEETSFDLLNDSRAEHRGNRGGSWSTSIEDFLGTRARFGNQPGFEAIGFRVAAVPEPSSLLSALMILTSVLIIFRRRRRGIPTCNLAFR